MAERSIRDVAWSLLTRLSSETPLTVQREAAEADRR